MQVTKEGSVRVDLVGGTLDLEPISLIIPNVVTINLALSLKAKVTISQAHKGVTIVSEDYSQTYCYNREDFHSSKMYDGDYFGPMAFVANIVSFFVDELTPIEIHLSSMAPAGSGLGGSSSMGVVVYQALCQYFQKTTTPLQTIRRVRAAESRILNQGVAGHQDYYPALYGGLLALHPGAEQVNVEQLYTASLKDFLESHVTLVYSGQSRQSGINNWEVYKAFFDKQRNVVEGLHSIARRSWDCYQSIKKQDFDRMFESIILEGQERLELFPSIATNEMINLVNDLVKAKQALGMKVCGAGGGGCFLILHQPEHKLVVDEVVKKYQMKSLNFCIESPCAVK